MQKKGDEVWVADTPQQKAIGFMIMEKVEKDWATQLGLKGKWMCIDWLDVHPNFQRQGVGTSLLEKAEQIARERKITSLCAITAITNEKMLRFSVRNGFKITKRLKEFWGEGTEDAFLLTKKIALVG